MQTLEFGDVKPGIWGGGHTRPLGDTPGHWVTPAPRAFGDIVFVTLRSEPPVCHLEARLRFSAAPKSLKNTVVLQHRVHFSGSET